MKRILIRSLIAALSAVLLLTAVSCDTDEGGIETIPHKETAAAPDTDAPDTDAPDTPVDTTPEQNPNQALDFTVQDWEGNMVKLSDFFGKPIVLNFWARGCIYCVQEMPDFQDAYEKYGDEVVFLMVCHVGFNNTTPKYEQALLDSKGYTFPAYYDTKHEAVAAYGVNALPQTWFIDRAFDLYTYIPGMATAESLEYCIQLILN